MLISLPTWPKNGFTELRFYGIILIAKEMKVKTTVMIEEKILKAAKVKGIKEDKKLSEIVQEALEDYLKRKNK